MGHKSHHHHSKEKERGHSKHKHHFSHSKRSSSQNSISSSSSSSTNSSSDSYSHHSHKKRKHHHKHHHKDKKNDKTVKSNSTETVKKENFLIGPSLPSSPGKLINVEKNLSDKNIQDINTTDNINKNFVGPMLPSFIQNDNENSNDESNNADKSSLIIGPSLPLSLNNNNSNDKQKINIIGPSLPSSFNDNTNEQNSRIIGPSLPSSLNNNNNNNNNEQNLNIIGPSLPASVENKINKIIEKSEESDDDIIGPLPMAPGHELTEEEETQRIINEFEERADRMKRKLEGKDEPEKPKKLVRDEWMTTLPEDNILDRINILKPRQFRKNGTTKIDRSGWTDTPADKLRKQKEGVKEKEEKIEYIQINKNDINMQKMVDKYNKEYRSESLYDQHAKEYFKNKKYEENDISKLPFDRERDVLGVGSKGSIGKANQLKGVLGIESANRFTHSSSKKFL